MTNEEKQLMGQGLKKIIEVYNLLEQGGHGFLHHIAIKTSEAENLINQLHDGIKDIKAGLNIEE